MIRVGEGVRLRGVVRRFDGDDGSPIVECLRVVTKARSGSRLVQGRDFELVTESGDAIRIQPAEILDVEAPTRATSELWSVARARFPDLPEDLAAPFEKVELHRQQILAGEEVALYGVATDLSFSEVKGSRDAPTARLGRVRASVIASGDQREQRLDAALARRGEAKRRPAPRPRSTDPGDPATPPAPTGWIFPAVLAATAAVLLLVAWIWQAPQYSPLSVLALALAVEFAPRRTVHGFRHAGSVPGVSFEVQRFLVGMFAISGVLLVFLPAPWLALGTSAIVLGLFLFELAGGTHRRLTAILAAPPLDAARPSGWCGGEGMVRDPTPVVVEEIPAVMVAVHTYNLGAGEDARKTLERTAFHVSGTFQIQTTGLELEVDPREVLWASYFVSPPPSEGAITHDESAWIPIDGRVAWAGRLERSEDGSIRLRHDGTRPALLVATSSQGRPLAMVRRVVWERRVALAAHAVALALSLWFSWRSLVEGP